MKILKLEAENFKRLKAVSITPSGDVVEITGRNGQGKSSVLDAIWAALGGTEALPAVPVRAGASDAFVRLDLGQYVITRKIKAKDDGQYTTSLAIESPDGTRPKSPQTLLNELMGQFSMDPLAFARMTTKGQFDALKVLVPGLDLDQIKTQNDADYERRTAENRKAKEAKAAAASIGAKEARVDRVDIAQITVDISRASDFNKSISDRQARRDLVTKQAEALESSVAKRESAIYDMEVRFKAEKEAMVGETLQAQDLRKKLSTAEPLPVPLDTAELAKRLAMAQEANAEAEKQERRDAALLTAERHENASKALTEAMEARDAHKAAAIANAKFPVAGLSLGSEEVLVDGLPFNQAATSQKIKTSVALAMAMNPHIRVIRIEDGSLLDSDALKIIADMARDQDFQIWIETVSDGTGSGIIIDDGHIKES